MSYSYTDDKDVTERLSQQRDDIYDYVVERFRYHMANEDVDSALALADEFFEWMDPDNMEKEETAFYNEEELLRLYMSLPEMND